MPRSLEDRVLVFGLFGADAALTADILSNGGITAVTCESLAVLLDETARGAGALLVAQEALVGEVAARLVDLLEAQPTWSDLPVVVSVVEEEYEMQLALGARVNVVALHRPVRVRALLGTVASALRARRRQYQTRDVLESLERTTSDLRALEEEMRSVVENLPELAWTARPDGHITFYNQRWYRYTGATLEEMDGWGWSKVHDPSVLPAVLTRWRRSLETGEPFEMEFPLRGADGRFRSFLTRATPLRDRAGRIVRWVGVNVDVDDKRRVAEERELYTKRAALLAHASELLSASFDVEERLTALAGALRESMATAVTIDLYDEQSIRRVIVDDASGERTDRDHEITVPVTFRGRTVGTLTVARPERAYTAEDLVLLQELADRAAVAIDNARLFAAAQSDRDRVARLQALAEAFSAARTPTEVAEVAMSHGTRAAGAQRGLVGVLAEGDTTLDVILMRGPAEAVAKWRQVPMSLSAPLTDAVRRGTPAFYATPEDVAAAFPHLADQRSPGDSALAVLPLTVGGRTFGAMGLVYDDPHEFPRADQTQTVTLARLCAQAMDRAFLFELAQRERLRAEEASRTKDEFLAMVSHELRTPLNAMLGWTRLLRSGGVEPSRQAKALETIERNAMVQTQLIEDLLDITRIVTGKLRLQVGPVDLAHVVDAAVETVQPAADARGVLVERSVEPSARQITGDPERLQQIVWNLLSNAVKFTPRGGEVHVRVHTDDATAHVDVVDTGVGISAEFLPHVFERFRQADGGTTRSYGGLGLGLAIVKHLVELHGGTIHAESNGENRGTTFRVSLPMAVARTASTLPVREGAQAAHAKPLSPVERGPWLDGLRVLVVEDEPDARDLLVALLEQRAVDVRAAASSAEGLEHLDGWTPDVILSDVGMPVEDGYAFIQKVRALPRERGGATPAVALTAYARTEDRRRAMLAGFNMHVSKPIDPDELLVVLASLGGRLRELGTTAE